MTILKSKIKIIASLPPSPNDKDKKSNTIIAIILIILLAVGGYFIYQKLSPYIFAVNVNKITGKKINITKCNTKDYIIISKDKSYTMSLTNESCIQENYEGNLYTKDKSIIFKYEIEKETNKKENDIITKKIIGLIDENYNIIINNNLFEEEKKNEGTTTRNIE